MDASTHGLGNPGAGRVQGVVDIEPDYNTIILFICQWSDNPACCNKYTAAHLWVSPAPLT